MAERGKSKGKGKAKAAGGSRRRSRRQAVSVSPDGHDTADPGLSKTMLGPTLAQGTIQTTPADLNKFGSKGSSMVAVSGQQLQGVGSLRSASSRNSRRASGMRAAVYDALPDPMDGFLFKLGHIVKNWKRRWIVLHRADQHLQYYAQEKDIHAKGRVALAGCTMERDDSIPHCVVLHTRDKDKPKFVLAADTEPEILLWMECIAAASGGGIDVFTAALRAHSNARNLRSHKLLRSGTMRFRLFSTPTPTPGGSRPTRSRSVGDRMSSRKQSVDPESEDGVRVDTWVPGALKAKSAMSFLYPRDWSSRHVVTDGHWRFVIHPPDDNVTFVIEEQDVGRALNVPIDMAQLGQLVDTTLQRVNSDAAQDADPKHVRIHVTQRVVDDPSVMLGDLPAMLIVFRLESREGVPVSSARLLAALSPQGTMLYLVTMLCTQLSMSATAADDVAARYASVFSSLTTAVQFPSFGVVAATSSQVGLS